MGDKGYKLYKKAKKIIPNGNMLLSKRPDNFLPDIWPNYFQSTTGCHVTDIDGNSFIDVSLMGVGTNIIDKSNLNQHLLEGLNPKGVPSALSGTTIPFEHNNLDQFKKLIEENDDIAAVKMEVQRNFEPSIQFLTEVRRICTERNIVLIFDECTSGFRETFGGIFNKFKVFPDIALFSKALGNGYAICACVGKESVMSEAKNTFISSTFWTERIGPTAAISTLDIMEEEKSWEFISNQGKKVKEFWKVAFSKNAIDVEINGLDPLPRFQLKIPHHNKIKTLITYLMMKKGFLATDSMYICIKHDDETLQKYYNAFEQVLYEIKDVISDEDKFDTYDIKEAYKGFQRLN